MQSIRLKPSISIHAPRTGSDGGTHQEVSEQRISIHAPRTGSDRTLMGWTTISPTFQSTLPARGATVDLR